MYVDLTGCTHWCSKRVGRGLQSPRWLVGWCRIFVCSQMLCLYIFHPPPLSLLILPATSVVFSYGWTFNVLKGVMHRDDFLMSSANVLRPEAHLGQMLRFTEFRYWVGHFLQTKKLILYNMLNIGVSSVPCGKLQKLFNKKKIMALYLLV